MDEIWGSQGLSMITAKRFSTFQKFKEISKILNLHLSQKRLEIERNGANLLHAKLQILKFLICCFLIG